MLKGDDAYFLPLPLKYHLKKLGLCAHRCFKGLQWAISKFS